MWIFYEDNSWIYHVSNNENLNDLFIKKNAMHLPKWQINQMQCILAYISQSS